MIYTIEATYVKKKFDLMYIVIKNEIINEKNAYNLQSTKNIS